MPPTQRDAPAKRWCFTLKNYTPAELTAIVDSVDNFDYLCFGKEVGGTNNTPYYLQGFFILREKMRLNQVKQLDGLSHAHFKKSRETPKQASYYCKRHGDFFEYGKLSKQKKTSFLKREMLSWRWPRDHFKFLDVVARAKAYLSTSQIGVKSPSVNLELLPSNPTTKWASNWKYRNSERVLLLNAESVAHESNENPLVPPCFDRADANYSRAHPDTRRRKTRCCQLQHGLNNASRKHSGSFFSGEYIAARGRGVDLPSGIKVPKMKIIDTCVYDHGFIDVSLPDGSETTIDFHCAHGDFAPEMERLRDACLQIAILCEKSEKLLPQVREDMVKLGVVSMCGASDVVVPASRSLGKEGLEATRRLNIFARELCQSMMPRLLKEMEQRSPALVSEKMGGRDGLCSVIFQSKNLQNEAHFDPNDLSKCFVQWFSVDGKDHEGWYIIFNNLRVKEKDGSVCNGLAIKLRDGIVVSWDGREVSHCSTRPTDERAETYGTWFGVSKRGTGHR